MKAFDAIAARTLDAIDVLFEALSAVYRVLMRGAFAADAKSYRGSRFAPLSASDVLVQEIELNAADQSEARKAITLDPENVLPLSPDIVAFDIGGPLENAGLRARPERRFLLGVIRKDALAKARGELPAGRRGGIEAFTFTPPAHPQAIFVFGDEAGKKRRRLRRALTAIAALTCAFALSDAIEASRSALHQSVEAADAERVQIERRIRLAERRVQTAQAAVAATTQAPTTPIGDVALNLALMAQQQPQETEIVSAEFNAGAWQLAGRSFNAEAAELQWRRAFEHQSLAFNSEAGELPQPFSVRITARQQATP